MRAFSHEHVFRAPSVEAVFATYFDPRHATAQDRELEDLFLDFYRVPATGRRHEEVAADGR